MLAAEHTVVAQILHCFSCFPDGPFTFFFLQLLTYRHLFCLHIFAIADFINPSAHLEYCGSEHRATIPAPSNHKTALHLSGSVVADVKLGSLVKGVFLANSFSRH